MLTAELAVLVHFKSVRIVLLVFLGIVVSLLAFCACESYLNPYIISHLTAPSYYIDLTLRLCVPPSYGRAQVVRAWRTRAQQKSLRRRGAYIIPHFSSFVNTFLEIFPILRRFFGAVRSFAQSVCIFPYIKPIY